MVVSKEEDKLVQNEKKEKKIPLNKRLVFEATYIDENGYNIGLNVTVEVYDFHFKSMNIKNEKHGNGYNEQLEIAIEKNKIEIRYNRKDRELEDLDYYRKYISNGNTKDFIPLEFEEEYIQSPGYYNKWRNNKLGVEDAKEMIRILSKFYLADDGLISDLEDNIIKIKGYHDYIDNLISNDQYVQISINVYVKDID